MRTPQRLLKYNHLFCGIMFSVLSVLCIAKSLAEPVRIRADNSHNQVFIRDALKLALSKADSSYEWEDVVTQSHLTEPRHIKMIKEGQLDVFWQTTSRKLEQQLLPIRIPIYRGLMGYRLLVIHKNTQFKFDRVQNIEDLKHVRLGQGKHWPDTAILQANGLNVVTAPLFLDLYPMLKFHRFDAFPRGLNQVWHELSWFSGHTSKTPKLSSKQPAHLAVEERILIKYISPMYFFVSRDKPGLANTIEKGLRTAIEDGSYQRLFLSNDEIRSSLIKANIKNRNVIQLDNPFLPSETPVGEHALWFDPGMDIPDVDKVEAVSE